MVGRGLGDRITRYIGASVCLDHMLGRAANAKDRSTGDNPTFPMYGTKNAERRFGQQAV